jgi:hypothetical protein
MSREEADQALDQLRAEQNDLPTALLAPRHRDDHAIAQSAGLDLSPPRSHSETSISQAVAADSCFDLRSDRPHTERPALRGANSQPSNKIVDRRSPA